MSRAPGNAGRTPAPIAARSRLGEARGHDPVDRRSNGAQPLRGGPMTQIDDALTAIEPEDDEDTEAEDVLVEEISIDGMCGVY